MCVVALAWQVHPDYPLILLGNRDEFHARAAAPLHRWNDGSGIVAGRDLQAGGTWLGLHAPSGRAVVVTNVRGAPPDPAKASRGALVTDLLRGEGEFADPHATDLDRFNAFNLLMIDDEGPLLLANRAARSRQRLAAGIHALANEAADAPCPRAARLGDALASAAANGDHPETLLDTLRDEAAPTLFLRGTHYGTRASTLLLIDRHGNARMIERPFDAEGNLGEPSTLSLAVPPPGTRRS